jgi:hypothetical protein
MVNKYTRKHRRTQKNTIQYSQEDYDSNNGMMTQIFGPATWVMLHTISFNYPVVPTDLDKKHYKEFVLSLQNILPCGKCRKNLVRNFKKLPLEDSDLTSRETFSKYVYNLHETVNTMLGKKSGLSYENVRDTYERFRARCAITKGGKTKKTKHKGCIVPLNGKKTKCILRIVPQTRKCKTFM